VDGVTVSLLARALAKRVGEEVILLQPGLGGGVVEEMENLMEEMLAGLLGGVEMAAMLGTLFMGFGEDLEVLRSLAIGVIVGLLEGLLGPSPTLPRIITGQVDML